MERKITTGRLMTAIQLEQYLGITRNMAYALLHRDDFPSIQIGGSWFALGDQVDIWLQRQAEEGGYKFG